MTTTFATDEDFEFRCQEGTTELCPTECVGLVECLDCECAIIPDDAGGPWGDAMDVIFGILPIVFLIIVTVKSNPMPTTLSLPLSAVIMFLVRVMYLGSDPILTCGAVILGLHEALTPLSIMAGAIALFEAMEATKCLPFMMREMKALTAGHPIAELMLIFSFAYMIEGASGFGTPVALGAPMLVSTGHDPLKSVVVLLIMNTFATVWGAVGTPIWFGFGGLTDEDGFQEISYKAAIALCFGSIILIPFVLTIIVPFRTVRRNVVFILASLITVLAPSVGLAFGSYEFPSLMGGLIGCLGTAVLIRCKVGLAEIETEDLDGRDAMDIGSVCSSSIVGSYKSSYSARRQAPLRRLSTLDSVKEPEDPEKTEMFGNLTSSKVKTALSKGVGVDDDTASKESNQGAVENPPPEQSIQDGSTADKVEEMENSTVGPNMDTSTIRPDQPPVPSLQDTVDRVLGPRKEFGQGYLRDLVFRTFPIWAVVLLLILTRVQQIGLKDLLTLKEPNFTVQFGTYGTFRLSASLVFQLNDILTYPGLNWKFELLYLPFLMPFCLVSVLTVIIFRKDLTEHPKNIAYTVCSRLYNPAFALLGALCLVQLLIKIDTAAPAFILGSVLADWFKEAFIMISPLLGALGSFFSGSTTVSNLTFGNIQMIAAESIGTSATTMLALQACGASAGNGICLNNIIAACAVVGLNIGEGQILKQTYKFVLASTTISTIVMLAFFFRF